MLRFLRMALTNDQRRDLKNRFIRGIKNALAGDPGNTLGGQPVEDFLAGTAPSNPFSRFQYDAGRRACRRWATGRSPSIFPGRDIYWRNLCEPYIEQDFGPLGDATSAPPFVGGQCVGTVYAVDGQFIPQSGNPAFPSFFSGALVNGRVTGVVTRPNLSNPAKVDIWVTSSTGPDVRVVIDTFPNLSGLRITNVVRVSGNPDTCGSLPDDFNPGTGPSIPPETGPIPSPPGWQIPDFDIDITFNPDGTIAIDFGDGEPGITIDPGADDGEPTPGPQPGDQGEPGTPSEAGESDAEGEAPEGKVLVGVRLQLSAAPPNAKKFAPVVYRGAAYIYMGGDVGLDQDYAGSMLVSDQFIYAEKDNLTRYKVIANQGFRWTVTPYFRDFEP